MWRLPTFVCHRFTPQLSNSCVLTGCTMIAVPEVSDGQIAAHVVLHAGRRGDQVQDEDNEGEKNPNDLPGFCDIVKELQYHFHFRSQLPYLMLLVAVLLSSYLIFDSGMGGASNGSMLVFDS